MKKFRIIRIRDPKLREIRNNLREILLCAFHENQAFLNALVLGASNLRKKRELRKELEELEEKFDKSICICAICRSIIDDMVYIPRHKVWFCVNCREKNYIPIKL